MTGLAERLRETEANSLDRRRISDASRRRLAEAIHFGETDAALREIYHVLTGEYVADTAIVRDVAGQIDLGSDVTIAENERLVLDLTLGGETRTVYVDGDGADTYRFREVASGSHGVSVEAVEWVEYGEDMMDQTRYAIDSATLSLSASSISVDPETTDLDVVVSGPSVTVDSITVGAELSEDSQ